MWYCFFVTYFIGKPSILSSSNSDFTGEFLSLGLMFFIYSISDYNFEPRVFLKLPFKEVLSE